MENYRIEFNYPFYSVQERMTIGWGIFKRNLWFQLDFFYNLKEAEEFYKTLTTKWKN